MQILKFNLKRPLAYHSFQPVQELSKESYETNRYPFPDKVQFEHGHGASVEKLAHYMHIVTWCSSKKYLNGKMRLLLHLS